MIGRCARDWGWTLSSFRVLNRARFCHWQRGTWWKTLTNLLVLRARPPFHGLACSSGAYKYESTPAAHQMFHRTVLPKLLDIRLHLCTGETMAHISLDSQTFFTPPAAELEPTRRNLAPVMTGSSQNDAVMISSDEESDYGDLDDGQSDTSFPSVDELRQRTIHEVAKPGSVASAGMCLSHPSLDRSLG